MDYSRYRELFISEARDHIAAISSLSLSYEDGTTSFETVNKLFRHAHSIKGMAATMQFASICNLAHALEDLLVNIRNGVMSVTSAVTDMMLAAADNLEKLVMLVEQQAELPDTSELAERIRSYSTAAEDTTKAVAQPETKHKPPSYPSEITFRNSDEIATTRIKTSLLDRLVTISGELLTVRYTLQRLAANHDTDGMTVPLKELTSLLRQLQTEVFKVRMLPFAVIAERFPRMVRDLARKSGKEINFQISGTDIEMDRGILEQVVEPLLHLLRNSVDHGIEMPQERTVANKPPVGSLSLAVSRLSDQVLIQVTDDGRGIDPVQISKKAVTLGLLNADEANGLTDQEALFLICTPGFTTASVVSDVSGRGVGMDVVKTSIHSIGGSLSISSVPGNGTSITISLPLSVAIVQALIVNCGKMPLAVPVSAINSICEIRRDEIVQRGNDLYMLHDGKEVPVRNLPRFFRQSENLPDSDLLPVLMTESNRQPVGLLVDRLVEQQEIFIRPLLHPLADLRGISASSLMGNGQIIFVVDPAACSGPLSSL